MNHKYNIYMIEYIFIFNFGFNMLIFLLLQTLRIKEICFANLHQKKDLSLILNKFFLKEDG